MTQAAIDPELEEVFAAQVDRGEFASVQEARTDFFASLDEAIEEVESGGGHDGDAVFAELRDRFAHWPRAAE